MSALAEFLYAYDETALVTACSKGVVIRAGKDAVAANFIVEMQSADEAKVKQGDETIILSGKGLNACRCTCPATGTCRHIVAVILFLRAQTGERGAQEGETSGPAPMPVSLEEIQRFARGDWPIALALADAPVELSSGASHGVRFTETGESVTFPRGQSLTEALFKGPRNTRKRRVVAAAALILLRETGVALPENIAPDIPERKADFRILDLAQAALRQAAIAVAAGQVLEAGNRLFTVGIAARTEAIPRLAATLRSLSERSDPERLRRAEDRPEALLAAFARCYALAEALRMTPADPALLGTLARSFTPYGPHMLFCLGARHWQNPSGARGFSIMLFDPEAGQFHTATEARGAGIDMGFLPQRHWQSSFWGAGSAPALKGYELLFDDLLMAHDGALSLTQTASRGNAIQLSGLTNHDAAIRQWDDLHDYLRKRRGIGLRRQNGQVFALLVPEKTARPGFDPMLQAGVWTWFDQAGAPLTLILPPEARPGENPANVSLGMVAFGDKSSPELIAVWHDGEVAPRSLQNEALPQYKKGWRDKFFDLVSRSAPLAPEPVRDPLDVWFDRAIEAILIRLAQRHGSWPAALINDAEALGLHNIASLLNHSNTGPLAPEDAIRLTYLLDQTRELLGPLGRDDVTAP